MVNAINSLLRELRKENRYSQRTLSLQLSKDGQSIDATRISRIESGARPFWDEVAIIADSLNLSDKEIIALHRSALRRFAKVAQ